MALSAKQRRSLLAESHQLKPAVMLAPGPLSESAVRQVREAFRGRELIKVRVQSDSRGDCDDVAEQLAARVPCEIVKRVGRVVVLFGQKPDARSPRQRPDRAGN
jgi:RNA-binding protein